MVSVLVRGAFAALYAEEPNYAADRAFLPACSSLSIPFVEAAYTRIRSQAVAFVPQAQAEPSGVPHYAFQGAADIEP